jgi:hypothetical protein
VTEQRYDVTGYYGAHWRIPGAMAFVASTEGVRIRDAEVRTAQVRPEIARIVVKSTAGEAYSKTYVCRSGNWIETP